MISKSKYVIWPIYFDLNISRSNGRRVPKSLAIQNPSIDDILKAAKRLRLNPILEEKAHPSRWWSRGRILVDKKEKKREILRKIAEQL